MAGNLSGDASRMTLPESTIDLFSDETLANTAAAYQALRDTGPIVFLPANDLFAVTQYQSVKQALRADLVLVNSKGVAANPIINDTTAEATLTSDGETHLRRRAILMRPLTPRALEDVKQRIDETADRLVQDLMARDEFCGVADFASHLPVSIVADLVGLEESGRENMLEWAAATFNALGPLNGRTQAALHTAADLIQYVHQLGPDRVRDGGWAARILAEAQSGVLTPGEGAMMVVDYVAPSLDTTILASAQMLWRLASTDGAFDTLRSNPDLVPSVVNESVRLASPIREFTRYAASDYEADGLTIPAGGRAAMLYASANWDERHYADADQFQVDRNPRDHLGWGHGAHTCAGMHLARLEMEALARALIRHVKKIEADEP
ncbi:MAG: cytochrome P450, partial [Pseudomonadota bacterium]